MKPKDTGNICCCYVLVSIGSAYGLAMLLGIPTSSSYFMVFIAPAVFVFLVLYISLTLVIKKNKKSKKAISKPYYPVKRNNNIDMNYIEQIIPHLSENDKEMIKKLYGDKLNQSLEFQIKKEENLRIQRSHQLKLSEERINTELNNILALLVKDDLNAATKSLEHCKQIIRAERFDHLKPKLRSISAQVTLFTKKYKEENSMIIKEKILTSRKDVDRLLISEIMNETNIHDEPLIIEVVQDLIDNQEINAEYFESSKSILFNLQGKALKIDNLLDTYKDWEDERFEKRE